MNYKTFRNRDGKSVSIYRVKWRSAIVASLLFSCLIGVVVTDMSGVNYGGGFLNASNVLRFSIFMLTFLYLYVYRLRKIFSSITKPVVYLLTFYLFSIISIIYNNNWRFEFDELPYIYSLLEWVILITLAAYLIDNSKEPNFEGAAQVFKTFFKSLSLALPALVLAGALVRPDLAFFPTPGWTLGGFMIHPNKLSVVCALGICVWMSEHKSPFRLVISLGLFTVALMTGSRSGSLLSAFALLHGLGSLVPRRLLAPLYFLMAACLVATALLIFGYAGFMQGNDLTNLNGRDAVWRATRYMVSQKPFLGWGWIEGPGQLGFYTGEDWWFSHNAQNDILNFAVSNGIAAGLASAYFYLRTLVVTARYEFDQTYRMLFSASIVIFFSSLVEPISSNLANMVGFALIFLILISFKKRKIQYPIKRSAGETLPRIDQKFTPNYARHTD